MNELALELTTKCYETKDPCLDLGNCGLRDEDFKEDTPLDIALRKCTHLEKLILSSAWQKWDEVEKKWKGKNSQNKSGINYLNILPSSLLELPNLQELICCGYKELWGISDASLLQVLTGLRSLDLSYNKISDVSFLQKLTVLQSLDIRDNKISDISCLEALTALRSLNLGYNQISDISCLKTLTGLRYLDLSYNRIYNATFLEILQGLQSLDLSFNKISNYNFLQALQGLQSLNLHDNKISDYSFLQGLKGLKSLGLSYHKILDANFLRPLMNLKSLDLSYNKISDISFLKTLKCLQSLDLSYNKISEIDQLVYLLGNLQLADVKLENNPVLNQLPKEVVEAGWQAMRDRLISIRDKEEQKPLREVKLLLLGNTNVGKSNLAEYFETNEEPMQTDSTHGTQYKILQNVVENVNINCWDFGGQDFFHATHRLFFSPGALHVVLWSKVDTPREESEACFDLNYWLRSIEELLNNFYGKDKERKTEVIICENKIDKQDYNEARPSMNAESFKDLNITLAHINLKPLKKTRIEYLKGLLAEKAEGLFNTYSISYHNYLSAIRNHPGPVILMEDISNDNIKSVQTAVRVFHNMGLLLYFPDIISEKVFCKPQALLDLLYNKILNRETNYRLSKTDIKNAIANNELELTEKNIIDLLKYFDLIFQIWPQDDIFFIPQYLPPATGFMKMYMADNFDTANIRIESDHYLMSVAMQKIYSYYGNYVESDASNEYLFWKDGIIIKKGAQKLMIKFDRAGQSISLFPDKQDANFDLQHELTDYILNIPLRAGKARLISEWNGDEFTFYKHEINWQSDFFDVYVSAGGAYFVKWMEVFGHSKKGLTQIEAFSSNNIAEAQSKIMPVMAYQQFLHAGDIITSTGYKHDIFFSYAWGVESKKLVDALYDSLEADNKYNLLRDKKDVGYCDLFSTFMQEMGKGELIVVVISDRYLTSRYCMFELYEIYRNSRLDLTEFEKKIFPIFVEDIALKESSVIKYYKEYWEGEQAREDELRRMQNHGTEESEVFNYIKGINMALGNLLIRLRKMNVSTKEELSADNFEMIKAAINKRIQELSA